jgi:hypothetical protein
LGVLVAFDNAVVRLAAGLVIGGGVYLGVLLLVRSHELTELRTVLRRAPADPEPADAP